MDSRTRGRYYKTMTEKKSEQFIALLLILAGIGVRLLPHPANFTPLTAIALFSGTVLSPGLALSVPLIAMMASDLVLGPHPLCWLVWGSFILTVGVGFWVKRNQKIQTIFLGTAAGSILFFILTNFGVFWFQNMYAKNWTGLADCYLMAVPFFRNSLLGDLFYSAVFFGIYAMATHSLRHSRESGNQI